jgi:orotate phosphoribosyltransferase
MFRTQSGWISQYKQKNALWIHDGKPARPHALLTSGKHSGGFFNSRLVIPDEELLHEAASDLVQLFMQCGGDITTIDGVVGPQTGATKLAELMSEKVGLITGRPCFWTSPAKSEQEGMKSMVFSDEDLTILPNKKVLLCEDVLTTGGSIALAATAAINAGCTVLPFILVLVNRSGLRETEGKEIVGLIDRSMPMWAPEECPLCAGGSEPIRPKDNWTVLNAVY